LQGLQSAKAAGFRKRVYILAAIDALMSAPHLLPVLKTSRDIAFPVPNRRPTESYPHNFWFARQNEAARAADASACEMQAFETVV